MKKLIGIVLLFVFVCIIANKAYAISIDSLRVSVINLPDDTTKVLELSKLSKQYLKYQIDTSFILAKKAIQLSRELNYYFGYATSFNQMGLVFKYLSEYDSSLYYYNKSAVLFDSLKNNFKRAQVLNRMGNVYKRYGEYDNSIDCFHKSLKIYQNLKDSIHMSWVINNLGVLYYDMGYYDKSLEYYLAYLNICKKLNQNSNFHIVYMNIANVYSKKKNYDKAIENYKLALDFLENVDNKYDRLLLIHNIGTCYEESHKYKEAKYYYLKAISIEKAINEKEMLIFSLQGIGNVLIKSGKYSEGISYLKESFQLATEIGDVRKEHKLSKNLYQVYENIGNYKEGMFYLKKYATIEDSIYSLKKKAQFIKLGQKYEAEKREQQIAFLEKEQQIQKLELSKKNIEAKQKSLQRNILILIVVFVIILAAYFAVVNKKRKRLNKLLIKQNRKIVDQRTEIVKRNDQLLESNKTKDKLFQIIAHDLRSPLVSMDSITQLIPYWIEEQDYESLGKLSKTLELSVTNLLSLVDNLLNWALSKQGKFPFKPGSFKIVNTVKEAMGIYIPIAQMKNIDLKFIESEDAIVFADKNMLLTIIRNLLNNAIKFTAEKGVVRVGIDYNQQFAKIWVKDSGIGIPKEKRENIFEISTESSNGTKGEVGKGIGLFFCKEFVNLNNGDVFIESEPGEGTTITFTLPLFNIPEN